MLIKKYVFCEEESRKSLYLRTDGIVFSQRILLQAGQKVQFDTQFHMFSVKKWLEQTNVRNVTFRIAGEGQGYFRIFYVKEGSLEPKLLCQKEISLADTSWTSDDISLKECGEFLYIALEASTELRIDSVEMHSKEETAREIYLACGICTYKREQDCKRTVEALQDQLMNNEQSVLYQHLDIFVADNGNTLQGDSLFTKEHTFLFQNKNYGGAAGFTRCMIEACIHRKQQGYTHMLLMDDDALIEPSVVEDTAIFLSHLKEEYTGHLLGGILMDLDDPTMQMERGGLYKADVLTLNKAGLNLSDVKNVMENEKAEEINYNGWFYACIPAQVIREDNLPMPFFIHGDDIEYGLRFQGKVLTKNDLAVWHPNPSLGSNTRDYMRYYDTRNFLVIDALYFPEGFADRQKKKLEYRLLSALLPMRYLEAEFLLWGIEDFLQGPAVLMEKNAQELNQEVLAKNKKELLPLSEPGKEQKEQSSLSESRNILDRDTNPDTAAGWGKRSLLNLLYPFGRKEIYMDQNLDPTHVDLFGVKNLYLVDQNKNTYFVRKRSLLQFVRNWIKLWQLEKKLKDTTVEEYQAMEKKMKSYEFWCQYLDIEK